MKLKVTTLFILLVLACFTFSTRVFAQPDPVYRTSFIFCANGEVGIYCVQGRWNCTVVPC
jgi:hypothetical protein